jgi:argininosuccinate lyase
MKNIFIFIESNTTGSGALLLKKAVDLNFKPVFICADPYKYCFLPMAEVDVMVVDTMQFDLLANSVAQLENVVGIYSTSEYYIEMASKLAAKFELMACSAKVIRLCREKWLFNEFLAAHSISTPATQIILDEVVSVDNISFPVVVKPVASSGSVGVRLCRNEKEYAQAIHFIFTEMKQAALIQEFIVGDEYSVEVCVAQGELHILGITKKYTTPLPLFIEIGHDFPASLSINRHNEIISVVTDLFEKLNYDFGFAHVEIIVNQSGIFIIECNPRLAGGMIPELISKATGVDVLDFLLRLYSGHSVDFCFTPSCYASIRHVIPDSDGQVRLIGVNNSLESTYSMARIRVGDRFQAKGDFRDRIAYTIAWHEDRDQCAVLVMQALNEINIIFEDEHES